MSMINIGGPTALSRLSSIKKGDIQPNAVDLRLGKVFCINIDTFILDEETKVHRGSKPMEVDINGYYHLIKGSYEVIMENEIHVGSNEAGFVITRSTLNRNGVFITSGLYDSGYKGVMAGVMHVNCGLFRVKRGTRVGQYLNWKSEALSSYDGSYGSGKEHDKKYSVKYLQESFHKS